MKKNEIILSKIIAFLSFSSPTLVFAQTASDMLIQPPELSAPERGSVAGQYSGLVFEPGQMSRGDFSLSLPINVPQDRGTLMASIFPSYSPGSGLSEWGIGWQAPLEIKRATFDGQIDYVTDHFVSPWGRLIEGSNGDYYPAGMTSSIRISPVGDEFHAYMPDGSVAIFGRTSQNNSTRIETSQGIYAWYLTSIEDIHGARTELKYTANTSGRPFLEEVFYGGHGQDFQYRVRFHYDALTVAIPDYSSGKKLDLDQRISSVSVDTKDSGAFSNRWHYPIAHAFFTESPSFFLTSIERHVESSGEFEILATYEYDDVTQYWQNAVAVPSTKAKQLIDNWGDSVYEPDQSTPLDGNDDGMIDLEYKASFSLIKQTSSGFVEEPLGPVTAALHEECRPDNAPISSRDPRLLVKVRGSDFETEVLVVEPNAMGGESGKIVVCKRNGDLVEMTDELDWIDGFDRHTRVVDLNNDNRPDIVHLKGDGELVIYENLSTPTTIDFQALGTNQDLGSINALFSGGFWGRDINGDGIVDIVTRESNRIFVWYGKGNLTFEASPEQIDFNSFATPPILTNMEVLFIDANKDGLPDALVKDPTAYAGARMFINGLSEFSEIDIPNLYSATSQVMPSTLDLIGSGNAQVVFLEQAAGSSGGAVVKVFELHQASTGLMRQTYDARGTTLQFDYGRAPAVDGVEQRHAVLTGMQHESQGYDTVAYTYDYSQPILHNEGHLLGYREVSRVGPRETHLASFIIEHDIPPVLEDSVTQDHEIPDLFKLNATSYSHETYNGVSWFRPATEISGIYHASLTDQQTTTTEYLAYDDLCPVETRTIKSSGELRTQIELASPSELASSLHCLPDEIVTIGTHPGNSSYDFEYTALVSRNSKGQTTQITAYDPGTSYVLQEITYDTLGRLATVSSPGKGTSSMFYDGDYNISEIEGPNGVIVEATRESVSDLLVSLDEHRPGMTYSIESGFDGLERLERRWDSLGLSSELDPLIRFQYQYATETDPAVVETWTKADNGGAQMHTSELFTAGGDPLLSAVKLGTEFRYGTSHSYNRNDGSSTSYRVTDDNGINPADLANMNIVAERALAFEKSSAFGEVIDSWSEHHDNVQTHMSTDLQLSGGRLLVRAHENGIHEKVNVVDDSGNTVMLQDEIGTRFSYTYDTLDRMRRADYPDRRFQTVTYDSLGRLQEVYRDNYGRQVHEYDSSVFEQITRTTLFDRNDVARYQIDFSYDAIGRMTQRVHEDLQTGDLATYTFYYDGATPDNPTASVGAYLGRQTGIEGPGYQKTVEYRDDGSILSNTTTFPNILSFTTLFDYAPDGSIQSTAVLWQDAQGQTVFKQSVSNEVDADGFSSNVYLGRQHLARVYYDDEGLLRRVGFADDPNQTANNGSTDISDIIHDQLDTNDVLNEYGYVWDREQEVLFHYDSDTHKPLGLTQRWAGWERSNTRRFNDRGSVDYEDFGLSTSTTKRRHYTYGPRNFLSAAWDPQEDWIYEYDAFGLIEEASVNGQSEGTSRVPGEYWQTNQVEYDFDALGRVIERSNSHPMIFAYGPHGHLSTAEDQQTGDEWTFVYDEQGQRIMKFENGQPDKAYLGDLYLDVAGQDLIQPFEINERIVGMIYNGNFEMLPLGETESLLGDSYGNESLVAPYGARDRSTTVAQNLQYVEEAIAFVARGYDADTGLVRMGVRDFAPDIRTFTTPDPLFLGNISSNLSSYDANLYTYARNNPITVVDPLGLCDCQFTSIEGREYQGSVGATKKNYSEEELGQQNMALAGGAMVTPYAGDYVVAAHSWYVYANYPNGINLAAAMADSGAAVLPILPAGAAAAAGAARTVKSAGKSTATTAASKTAKNTVAKKSSTKTASKVSKTCSFTAGTVVLMCDGTYKNIEDVEEGDWVLSRDEHGDEYACKQAVKPYSNPDRSIIILEFEDEDGQIEFIETTDNHPFYVSGRGWTRVDELNLLDQVPSSDGRTLTVKSALWTQRIAVVYNFGVEDFHTYFVGEIGAWVHNCDFNWDHIFDRHTPGGSTASQRARGGGPQNSLFVGFSQEQIKKIVKDAWKHAEKKGGKQIDFATGHETQKFRGFNEKYNMEIEFWYNHTTKRVDSAYPADSQVLVNPYPK